MSEIEKDIVKAERPLLAIKLDRDHTGILLFLKSEVFEEHFKSISTKNPPHNTLGHKFYLPNSSPVVRSNGVSLMCEPELGLYHGENVNMSFLRCAGIKDGVTIKVPTGVYSKEKLTDWANKFKDGAKTYYVQVIKPVHISVEITTREL